MYAPYDMESISVVLSSHFSSILLNKDSIQFLNVAKNNESITDCCSYKGGYGKVVKLDWKGTPCAGKALHTANYDYGKNDEKYAEAFQKEIKLWKEMSHPHIVQLHGIWIQPQAEVPYMVMELLEFSLWQYLENCQDTIPISTKLTILHDVAKGLVYLHEEKNMAHRDLTTANILLTSSIKAKIGDFGQSRLFEGQVGPLTATPGNPIYSFMPPEVTQMNSQYGLSIDCFLWLHV